jgi:hypothetical protein
MATSTINGNAGAANSGSLVVVTPIDSRGAVTGGSFQFAVTNTGSYAITGLVSGTYILKLLPASFQPSSAAPSIPAPFPAMTLGVITVDGSSTYAI